MISFFIIFFFYVFTEIFSTRYLFKYIALAVSFFIWPNALLYNVCCSRNSFTSLIISLKMNNNHCSSFLTFLVSFATLFLHRFNSYISLRFFIPLFFLSNLLFSSFNFLHTCIIYYVYPFIDFNFKYNKFIWSGKVKSTYSCLYWSE